MAMRALPYCLCTVTLLISGHVRLVAQQTESVLELPPFVINTVMIPDYRWHHAAIPGFEILSEASEYETRQVVAALWRGRQLALPPDMRPQFDVPMTVIIFNQPPIGGAPRSLGSERKPGEMNRHWSNLIKRTSADRESFAINLWGLNFEYSPTFRFDLMTLLRRRAPGVPLWLSEGLFGGYGLYREGIGLDARERTINVKPSVWCSVVEFKAILEIKEKSPSTGKFRESDAATFLLPLASVLETPPPRDEAGIARWLSTAALFVRWGIYSQPERRENFWRFARRACSEPVTENLFREYFGQTYREVRAELSWYIKSALTEYASAPVQLSPMPAINLDQAKHSEIARILGEWLRIEAEALEAKLPEQAREYREKAAEKLQRIYDRGGVRDSRLLATMGLLALQAGQPQTATSHLTEAVAGKVSGPRVYLELASLRLAAAQSQGEVSPKDYADIVKLLSQAEQQKPPMRAVYMMLAELLPKLDAITPDQRAALERGLAYFPFDVNLHAKIQAVP